MLGAGSSASAVMDRSRYPRASGAQQPLAVRRPTPDTLDAVIPTEPRVVVLGTTGFLGPSLLDALDEHADVVEGGRDLVDLRDPNAIDGLLRCAAPNVVINAAAVNPGGGDDAMHAVNVDAAAAVAQACASLDARLVHVSTDVVHDGTAAPYADDAEAAPIPSYRYAVTKAAGEQAVLAACPSAVVVRSSLIWDPARIDNGTASFAAVLADGGSLTLWDDVLRQPVVASDLAELLVALGLEHGDVHGTMNAGGVEVLSRAAFGRLLLAHFDVEGRERVEDGPAPGGVATDLRLRTDGVAALGRRLRGVQEVLTTSSA